MPPHLRGNHAGCAASHKGVKDNAAFWTTGEKTGFNQLRRVGGIVTALEEMCIRDRFRIWATRILKEYMRKGFALDDERLKNLGGGGYFKELLERIRDIRASEKVFYRQVLEIYAASIDYDPKAEISIQFFKKVQNKIHYAIHGQTAAEVIYTRADAEKEFMPFSLFAHLPK